MNVDNSVVDGRMTKFDEHTETILYLTLFVVSNLTMRHFQYFFRWFHKIDATIKIYIFVPDQSL